MIHDAMDREVPLRKKRIRMLKLYGGVALSFFFVVFLYCVGIDLISPMLKQGEFKTAKVEIGDVYESLLASGIVESEFELPVLSPTSAKLRRIISPPGTHVSIGDTLLLLDTAPVEIRIEKLKDQILLQEENYRKNLLLVESNNLDQMHSIDVMRDKISSLQSTVVEEQELLDVGGISPEKVKQTKSLLDLAKKELQLSIDKTEIKNKSILIDQRVLQLNIKIAKRELDEENLKRINSVVRAPINGVVLKVIARPGQLVSLNSELVRLSDLDAYKVTGTISDAKAEKIHPGGAVLVQFNKQEIAGTIGNIRPQVENGQIKFDVFLDDKRHKSLRPNLQVDLYLVLREHKDVLKLEDGPFYDGSKSFDVFVVNQNKALRRHVSVGLNNFECFEILDGLQKGDEIITSDVSDIVHLTEIEIK